MISIVNYTWLVWHTRAMKFGSCVRLFKLQMLTRNNESKLRAPVRCQAPELVKASLHTSRRRYISCVCALHFAKPRRLLLERRGELQVKAAGGTRCSALLCRIHTRPSSQHQVGERLRWNFAEKPCSDTSHSHKHDPDRDTHSDTVTLTHGGQPKKLIIQPELTSKPKPLQQKNLMPVSPRPGPRGTVNQNFRNA
jgi:hypothetical protein